jgi:hypothetical protein
MKIIGCDFHPGYQQIAVLDLATGEMVEKALSHERKEEVRTFAGTCAEATCLGPRRGTLLKRVVFRERPVGFWEKCLRKKRAAGGGPAARGMG